jgi:hypothetical protein
MAMYGAFPGAGVVARISRFDPFLTVCKTIILSGSGEFFRVLLPPNSPQK